MQKLIAVGLLGVVLLTAVVVSGQAVAQGIREGGLGTADTARGGNTKAKEKERPPPPPLPRCPDLALATYQFVPSIPGATALATDEVAILWDVHNSGNAAYPAPPNGQSLVLEYSSPAGVTQVAEQAIPVQGTAVSQGGVNELGQNASWRGYMRATMTPQARRRPLRLKIRYGEDQYHRAANDCDMNNNEVQIALPAPTPVTPSASTTTTAPASAP